MEETNRRLDLLPNTVMIVIVLSLSISGNTIVMYVQWRKLRSNKNFRKFIPYLALSDLFAAVICSSFSIYENVNVNAFNSSTLCKAAWYIVDLSQCLSCSLLLLIAAHRFVICHPELRYSAMITKTFYVIAFVFVLLHPLSVVFTSDIKRLSRLDVNYTTERINVTIQKFIFMCLPYMNNLNGFTFWNIIFTNIFRASFVVTVVTLYGKSISKISALATRLIQREQINMVPQALVGSRRQEKRKICLNIWSSALSLSSIGSSSPQTSIASGMTNTKCRKYRNINIMFFVIALIAIVTYSPRIIILAVQSTDNDFWEKYSGNKLLMLVTLQRLYMVTYFTNPLIYSAMDKKFRQEAKNLFRRRP